MTYQSTEKPFAIFHEHPDWFKPLFAELERRGIPYVRLDAARHLFDPAETQSPYSLFFNRMSPRPTCAATNRASSTRWACWPTRSGWASR
jgi:hypothetical protein